MRKTPALCAPSVEEQRMPKLKDNHSAACPYCGQPRQLYRLQKTWRLWCGPCGIWWRFARDPRQPGQGTPNYEAKL
jgi:hypothetical protein